MIVFYVMDHCALDVGKCGNSTHGFLAGSTRNTCQIQEFEMKMANSLGRNRILSLIINKSTDTCKFFVRTTTSTSESRLRMK